MSEMELAVFRQRSREAMQQKARRGELFLTVAVGYVKIDDDRIEKDPDRRASEMPLIWCSQSSRSCRLSDRCWCGFDRRKYCFRLSFKAQVGDRLNGRRRGITRCTTC
jgi:hypothetical protein